jgi:hypothetical protein
MPLLGGLLVTLFTGLFDFFVKYFAAANAMRLALGAAVVVAFGVLYAAITAIVAGVVVVTPALVVNAAAMFLPGNVSACIAACLAVDAAVLGFKTYRMGIGA